MEGPLLFRVILILNSMFQYHLDTSSKKFNCPACDQKRFVRLVDMHTGAYCASEYGRCDREMSCGYFKYPKGDTLNTKSCHTKPNLVKNPLKGICSAPGLSTDIRNNHNTQNTHQPISHIPESIYLESMKQMKENTLYQWLSNKYSDSMTVNICLKYGVGSNPYHTQQTAFWQIDSQGRKRTAELIQYLPTGKRDRKRNPNWMHSILTKKGLIKDFNLEQVPYGAHLLQENRRKVAVVEGAKTAIVCALEYPEFLWIGTQGAHGLNNRLLDILNPSQTILVPDSGFDDVWRKKCERRFQIMSISEFVEEGEDLGDIVE